jgi:hypothetical protein
MTRISQFAKDLEIPYTKAKSLIDKGRSKKDNGSIIIERVTMETKEEENKNKNKKKKKKFNPEEFMVKPVFITPRDEDGDELFDIGSGRRGREVRPEKKKLGGSNTKKASNFGMLSVKAGIDNNPNPTKADRIAGATMKEKPVTASKGRYQSKAGEFRGCGAQVSGKKFKGVF